MNDKKKKIIFLVILAVALLAYFYITKKNRESEEGGGTSGGSSTGGSTGGSGTPGGSDTPGSTGGNTTNDFKIYVTDTVGTSNAETGNSDGVQQQKMLRDKKDGDGGKMYLTDGKGNKIQVDGNGNFLNSSGNKTTWKYYRTKKGVYYVYNSAVVALSVLLSWLPTSSGAAPVGFVKLDKWDSSKYIRFTGKKRYFSPYQQMFYVSKI